MERGPHFIAAHVCLSLKLLHAKVLGARVRFVSSRNVPKYRFHVYWFPKIWSRFLLLESTLTSVNTPTTRCI